MCVCVCGGGGWGEGGIPFGDIIVNLKSVSLREVKNFFLSFPYSVKFTCETLETH